MIWATNEIVDVLTFLLPGFIAAAIFYSLTSHPKPGAFDRVILALIFTLIGQMTTEYSLLILIDIQENARTIEIWEPGLSVLIAIILGLCSSCLSNSDVLHRFLRRLRMTRETSYPSEWYSTFARHGDRCYIVLHLQGERRLYGYAEEWPSDPTDGHFRMAEAEWLDEENKGTPLENVSAVLVPAAEVGIIEFLPTSEGAG